MDLEYHTRDFYPDELSILKTLKRKKEKEEVSKIKLYHFLIAGLFGAGLTYITAVIPDSFWTFLLGTIAILTFGFIVFTPREIYKQKKRHKTFLNQLTVMIDKGVVNTCHISSKSIAIAPEYEDESDLYIVKLNESEVLYLWDIEYNLYKKFPCLEFEIYEDDFFKLIGRQVYQLSEQFQPVKIAKKAKWNYMKQYGASTHLEIQNINFEELLEKYKNCA